MNDLRRVIRTVRGRPTSDGAGVRLTRVIGTHELSELDPFLLLDEFGSEEASDYIAGFPDHPHRGFETVTYMLAGRMRHRDHSGHEGLLEPGSVQWMTAGRGIVHSEMPEQESGLMRGFQLWVNLPARDKMMAPRYQEFAPETIPTVESNGATVRVIAGRFGGAEGPVKGIATEPLYLDVSLPARGKLRVPVPAEHTAFTYRFEGEPRGEMSVLGPGDTVELAAGEAPARYILVAGRALHEPIARAGPFVMNTQEEIRQAFEDLRAGRF